MLLNEASWEHFKQEAGFPPIPQFSQNIPLIVLQALHKYHTLPPTSPSPTLTLSWARLQCLQSGKVSLSLFTCCSSLSQVSVLT